MLGVGSSGTWAGASTCTATATGDDTGLAAAGRGGTISKIGGMPTIGTIDWTSSAAGLSASCTPSRTGVSITPLMTPTPASPAAPTYASAAMWIGPRTAASTADDTGNFTRRDSMAASDETSCPCPAHFRR
jgi:hypothetical protein